jgi:hypothetical protein
MKQYQDWNNLLLIGEGKLWNTGCFLWMISPFWHSATHLWNGLGSTIFIPLKVVLCWVPVAYTCNPNYLGGRDQEDRGWKPAWAKSLWDPISKILNTKRADGVAQGVGPDFKSQQCSPPKKHGRVYSYFCIAITNIWQKNLREERFTSAHSFRGFSLLLLGLMHLNRTLWQWWRRAVHLMADRKQRARQEGARDNLLWSPSKLLPPPRSHLLQFPGLPKLALPAGNLL